MNNVIRFIGDIHGENYIYLSIVNDANDNNYPSIQVGDYGCGFVSNPIEYSEFPRHKMIRGNHDNPSLIKKEHNFIPDGHYENGIFFIGGADSIDKEWRIEGLDWWKDEQLSEEEFEEIFQKYVDLKPKIVCSHDCPSYVFEVLMLERQRYIYGDLSRTTKWLQKMFDAHKPNLWIFGHHHYSFHKIIDGTEFICLDVYEHLDIDISNYQ